MTFVLMVVCQSLLIVSVQMQQPSTNFVTINTDSGAIRGVTTEVLGKKINQFWGIPYAVAPLNDLRFKPTQYVKDWDGVLDALDRPNSCYQVVDTMFNQFKGVNMWNPNTPMSEDCLKLNIVAPQTISSNLTTMIWIFGGSFNAGTATLDVYDPRYLAAYNDVIVVTFNYRFGPFGFLFFDHKDAPGNVGLLDQRLAFQWLHNNIKHFGGDRNKLSLFGESSGAVSISLHLLSRASWPYFNNAILQSGAYSAYWGFQQKEQAITRASELAQLTGCKKANVPETIACLRKVKPEELALKQWSLSNTSYYFDTTLGPTVDGDFLTDAPEILAKSNKFKQTSLLAGVNTDEASYFLVYGMPDVFPFDEPKSDINETTFLKKAGVVLEPLGKTASKIDTINFFYRESILPFNRKSNRNILETIAGDVTFKCPTIDFCRLYTSMSDNVYLYHFAHRSSFNPWPKYLGVMHGYEIDFVFGQPLNNTLNYTADEITFSKEVMKYWTNFAKTGNPNGNGPNTWRKFDNSSLYYHLINATGSASLQGLRYPQCTLITSLLPKLARNEQTNIDSCPTSAACAVPLKSIAIITTLLALFVHRQ